MITLNTQQHLKDKLLILSRYFIFCLIIFFLIMSFQIIMHKETSRL